MSQPSVASYFASRKRRASEELRAKSKVLILDEHDRKEILALIPEDQTSRPEQPAKSMVWLFIRWGLKVSRVKLLRNWPGRVERRGGATSKGAFLCCLGPIFDAVLEPFFRVVRCFRGMRLSGCRGFIMCLSLMQARV